MQERLLRQGHRHAAGLRRSVPRPRRNVRHAAFQVQPHQARSQLRQRKLRFFIAEVNSTSKAKICARVKFLK